VGGREGRSSSKSQLQLPQTLVCCDVNFKLKTMKSYHHVSVRDLLAAPSICRLAMAPPFSRSLHSRRQQLLL